MNTAVYDLAVSPPTWDMMVFLMGASEFFEDDFQVVIIPGPNEGFRLDELPPGPEMRLQMLWNIAVPLAQLVPACTGIQILGKREEFHPEFPEDYAPGNPTEFYGLERMMSLLALKKPPYIEPPAWALRYVRARLPRNPVTITLRHTDYWPERNMILRDWLAVAWGLRRMGYDPIFIRDPSRPIDLGRYLDFPQAELNLPVRAALYAESQMNLFVNNGPHCLAFWHRTSPYLIFDMINQKSPATTAEYFLANGLIPGTQLPTGGPRRRLVWSRSDPKAVLDKVEEVMVIEKEAASA